MRLGKEHVVLITGASRGIGAATAWVFARHGVRLILTARRRPRLERLARQIAAQTGVPVRTLAADLSQREAVGHLARQAMEYWNRVDVLVANAGVYVQAPVRRTTLADFDRSLAINFYAAVGLVLALLPQMLARGQGHIVLVTSMDAKKGIPPDGPYVAAKAALSAWGDVLRQELHGTGIGVSIVFPGRVDTDMVAHLRVPWISAKMPPERVARAILKAVLHNRAEVILPWHARLLWWLQAFAPTLADRVVRWLHLSGWPSPSVEEAP